MAPPKRSHFQREKDLGEMSRLLCEGRRQYEIAEMLSIHPSQITRDKHLVEKRWREAYIGDTDIRKTQELARIDNLERTYWAAWFRSLNPKETQQTKKTDSDKPKVEASLRKEGRDGNPAYLAGVMSCIERRCAILGLDAPLKVDIEQRVREVAGEMGLDPEEAVLEAQRVIRSAATAR